MDMLTCFDLKVCQNSLKHTYIVVLHLGYYSKMPIPTIVLSRGFFKKMSCFTLEDKYDEKQLKKEVVCE
jgi:hypothetical protein